MNSTPLYVYAFLLGLIFTIGCPTQARAQQSVTLRKGQLQQAGPYKAPLQIQILDERPIVTDHRRPEEAPESYVVPIPPMPTAQGQSVGGSSVRMVHNTLPQAGFDHTNIPTRGLGPARSLPSTKSGGLSPIDKAPRPIGLSKPQPQVSVTGKAPTAAAIYPSNNSSAQSIGSGSSGAEKSVKGDVRGRLISRQ